MESNRRVYQISPAIVVVALLQLVFIIFVVITINNILNHGVEAPRIKISNYSAIPSGELVGKNGIVPNNRGIKFSIDDTDKKTIESTIYGVASLNNKENIANSGAKIREDSAHYEYIEELNAYFLNFIVDIEDLGQSYRFVWLFGDDSLKDKNPKVVRLMAFCPKKDEMIYGDFDCKDEYDGRGDDIVVYDLIQDHLFNNFTTKLSGADNGGSLKIEIQLSPWEETPEEVAVQELSEYLSIFGFNLDDFDYEIITLRPYTIRR